MVLSTIATELFEEALTCGTMTLQNGVILTLKSSELISIVKFILGEKALSRPQELSHIDIPQEMLPLVYTNDQER
jgi:hypothetical protein